LLLLFGVVAGTQTELSFRPRITLVIFVIIVALVIVAFSISSFRNWVINRAKPIFNQVGPTLATIAQQPQRLLISLVSSLALNSAYIMAFYASLHAFGSEISLSVAAFVYLAGATLGQAAPTPGGIGAVEAALVAGLTAVGVASGMALSGVLLYRVVTFWLPVIPGWYSFANLQSKNLL
ncbi:MAG: flippase-like domain-containing protein, partial [Candidatus Nanopelagicales bacterium]|nr:flippase-like domain-containing protein [Candidatus Nanopelagicales bacterium]